MAVMFNRGAGVFGDTRGDIELWKKSLYTNKDIRFLFNNSITEYDMSKANISVLRKNKLITEDMYSTLLYAPKNAREYNVGWMLRNDKSKSEALVKGFAQERKRFMEVNGLNESNILDIRNDAIFVFGDRNKQPMITEFDDGIVFKEKRTYQSFVRFVNVGLPDVQLYWSEEDGIDVKGIRDEILPLHSEYFLDFMGDMFYRLTLPPTLKDENLEVIQGFYEDYCDLLLDVGYYREFNSDSTYLINVLLPSGGCSSYGPSVVTQDDLPRLNINFNANLLRQMFSYMALYYGVKK